MSHFFLCSKSECYYTPQVSNIPHLYIRNPAEPTRTSLRPGNLHTPHKYPDLFISNKRKENIPQNTQLISQTQPQINSAQRKKMPKQTIGFVGLGAMGYGMATHLVKTGYKVHGYDVFPASVERFAKAGGIPASSLRESAEDKQFYICMVASAPQAQEVLFGEGGVVQCMFLSFFHCFMCFWFAYALRICWCVCTNVRQTSRKMQR